MSRFLLQKFHEFLTPLEEGRALGNLSEALQAAFSESIQAVTNCFRVFEGSLEVFT